MNSSEIMGGRPRLKQSCRSSYTVQDKGGITQWLSTHPTIASSAPLRRQIWLFCSMTHFVSDPEQAPFDVNLERARIGCGKRFMMVAKFDTLSHGHADEVPDAASTRVEKCVLFEA